MSTANDDSLAAVSPTAKRAHDSSLAPEERTVQKKKQALSLASHVDGRSVHIFATCNEHDGTVLHEANDGTEDEEDAQDAVDRAFATFVAAHKIELSIFHSAEWANVLAAAEKSRYTISPLFFWRVLPSTYSTGLQKLLLLGHPNVCVAVCMRLYRHGCMSL